MLLPLLHDREMPVRNAAIVALGTFGDRRAFDPLVACLASSSSLDRKNAVQALVALGDPRRCDPFLEALKTEKQPSICMALIRDLSVFPGEKVLASLLELLTHQDEDVRATAAVALGKMGQSRALPALQHMALTDTNHETTLRGLWVHNSSIAQQAIHIILHPEQEQALDWPE
jgi:HEAT repeat protein